MPNVTHDFFGPHGMRPADHTCTACGIKVEDPFAPDHHVCVFDEATKKWTPSTADKAHAARLEREKHAHRP